MKAHTRIRLAEPVKLEIVEPLKPSSVLESGCVGTCPEHGVGTVRGTVVLAEPDYSIVHGSVSAGQLGEKALIHKRGDRSGNAGESVCPGKRATMSVMW